MLDNERERGELTKKRESTLSQGSALPPRQGNNPPAHLPESNHYIENIQCKNTNDIDRTIPAAPNTATLRSGRDPEDAKPRLPSCFNASFPARAKVFIF